MRYPLTKNFTKITETSGTIQNSSKIYAVEISDNPTAGSGFLLHPLNKISFVDKQLYARCVDVAAADVFVVPFVVDMGVGVASSATTTESLPATLKVWLPLNDSVTYDKCGNSWNVFGSPVIQDGALFLDGSSYLQMVGGLALGGQDFTVSAQVSLDLNAPSYAVFAELNTYSASANRFEINRYGSSNQVSVWANELWGFTSYVDIPTGTTFDLRIEYLHSTGVVNTYIDGVLKASVNKSLDAKSFSTITLGCGTMNTGCWKGFVRNFRIYSGGGISTEGFTEQDLDDIFKD